LFCFVGNAPRSDAAMLAKVSELVLPAIERSGWSRFGSEFYGFYIRHYR
jgi:hypothetical protein